MAVTSLPTSSPATRETRSVSSGIGNTFRVYLEFLLRAQIRGTLIWAIALAAYGAVIVAAFPSAREATDISSYPQGMRDALGVTTLSEIQPFLTAELFGYLPLVVAFIPITLFASALAGAEERGSLDILLGTPLPRRSLVMTTFISGAIKLLATLLLLAIALWLTGLGVDAGLRVGDALAGSLAAWPTAMVPGALALALSAAWRQKAKVQGVAIGALFAMYALDLVSKLVDSLHWLTYASVFHYYGDAVQEGVWWWGVLIQLGVIAVLVAIAVRQFERRDIYA